MANEYVKVGAAFRVTCDVRVDGVAQVDPSTSTGVVISYRRPDGTIASLTPDQITANTVSAKVTAVINPGSVSGGESRWRSGYPGVWEFYPAGTDAQGDAWAGEEGFVHVHPKFRNQA